MAPKQSKRTWGPSIFFPKAVLGHDVCFYFILSVSIAFTFYCKLDVISAQKCRCRNACYFISLYPGWAAAETCSKKSRAYPRTYTRGLADGIPMALLFMMVQQTPSLDASMGVFFYSFIYLFFLPRVYYENRKKPRDGMRPVPRRRRQEPKAIGPVRANRNLWMAANTDLLGDWVWQCAFQPHLPDGRNQSRRVDRCVRRQVSGDD